ncbi:hypothetical protein BD309DRAFT_773517 [Dichomitus squalens]|nr:hypothetical protein BD309DRAFT_773517 [Dichomitus squalens]
MTLLDEASLHSSVDDSLKGLLKLPSLDNTYGALFLGATFSFMIYGLIVHQTYRYYRLYPTDPLTLKMLVLAILLVETFHCILLINSCYFHLITNYFNPVTLLEQSWSLKMLIPTSALTTLLCQGFYARRIWLVDRRYRIIVGFAALPAVVFIGFAASATVENVLLHGTAFERFTWMVSAMFGASVIIEVLFSGTLIFILHRSRTGFKRTDSMIDLLILYTVNSGLLVSAIAVLGLIFPVIYPHNFIYIGMSMVETKLYASCVLTALNYRRTIWNRGTGVVDLNAERADLVNRIEAGDKMPGYVRDF